MDPVSISFPVDAKLIFRRVIEKVGSVHCSQKDYPALSITSFCLYRSLGPQPACVFEAIMYTLLCVKLCAPALIVSPPILIINDFSIVKIRATMPCIVPVFVDRIWIPNV